MGRYYDDDLFHSYFWSLWDLLQGFILREIRRLNLDPFTLKERADD